MTIASWQLPDDMVAASVARDHAARWAADLGWDVAETDDLVLVVSELVANGIRHGGPPVGLELSSTADGLARVVVTDRGDGGGPAPRDAAEDEGNGRGLALVQALSVENGWSRDGDVTSVWAVVRRRSG